MEWFIVGCHGPWDEYAVDFDEWDDVDLIGNHNLFHWSWRGGEWINVGRHGQRDEYDGDVDEWHDLDPTLA